MLLTDKLTINDSQRVITDEGYLLVPSKIGKANNIQDYLASELGLTDRSPLDIVKVFRPMDEVTKSIPTFNLVPVTNDHPKELVDSKTFKDVTCGVVSEVKMEGDYLTAHLIIQDDEAIKAIQDGKVELSNGYTCDLKKVDHQDYDYIQTNIKGNHVALVAQGRAGKDCKIADKKGTDMKITINDVDYECSESLKQAIMADQKARMDAYKEKEKELEDKEEEAKELKKDNEEKKAKMDAMSEKLSVSALDSAIEARLNVIDSAKKLIKDFDYKGKSVDDIKKEVVSSKVDVADKSAEYINARFDIMVEDHKPESNIEIGLGDAIGSEVADSLSIAEKARQDFINRGK